jgi:ribonuclease P protein component
VVVHLTQEAGGDEPPQVGFVVSKAVGNAVHRNLVKRRLRAASANHLDALPARSRVVVRALPAAVDRDFAQLDDDLAACIARAVNQWRRRTVEA